MNSRLCNQLGAGCWVSGILVHVGFTYQIFSLPFCGSNQLNHFFCDIPPVLKLTCGDTFMIEMFIYVVAVIVVTIPFMLTLGSYVKIIWEHLESAFSHGVSQSLFRLLLPSHGCGFILWIRHHDIFETKFQSFNRGGQISFSFLHHCHTSV